MDRDFEITIGNDNLPRQFYKGKSFKLQSGERYFNNGRDKMHWFVWECERGVRPKGWHVHHKDGNTWNNHIDNLELVEANKHLSTHIKKRIEQNPEWYADFRKKGIEAAPKWHKSEAGLKWHSEHAKKTNFGKFEYVQAKCLQCGTEYTKKTHHAKFCHPNCKAKALRCRRKLEGKSLRPKRG